MTDRDQPRPLASGPCARPPRRRSNTPLPWRRRGAVHGGRRPDRPGEGDLAHERRPRRRRRPRWPPTQGRRRWRGRTPDRRPGPRPRRPRTALSDPAGYPPPVEDGRHQLEPAEVEPGGLASGRAVGGTDERLDLHGEGTPTRLRVTPMAAPGTWSPLSEQAVDRSRPARGAHLEPCRSRPRRRTGSCRRGGPAARTRVAVEARRRRPRAPRSGAGQVTVLGDVAGQSTAIPRPWRGPPAHRCTSAPGGTRPGICVPPCRGASGWSPRPAGTAARAGGRRSTPRVTPRRERDASAGDAEPPARAATCAWDSSPDTNRHARPAAASLADELEEQGGLADPRLPRQQRRRTPARGRRLRTRSRSGKPVEPTRSRLGLADRAEAAGRRAAAVRRGPARGLLVHGAPAAARRAPPDPLGGLLPAVPSHANTTLDLGHGRPP